ncbi:hypothetical protein MMC25_007828 [Agyrium rufum]|nr:hypothetical protein [Agyrium rufum]
MDHALRCNTLKCRAQLTDQAVVTTCSHLFCISCATNLGLSGAVGQNRQCPACKTSLVNPDDVVATKLNPSEDYKTSVLSGLSPTAVMECAGRAIAFWSYQATQEIIYQEYLAKSLTDKYANLNNQMDSVISEANNELDQVHQKLQALQIDQDKLKQENMNLNAALREKNKRLQQSNDLYNRSKRKEMTAITQSAAIDSADEVLQNATHHSEHGETLQNPYRTSAFDNTPINRFTIDEQASQFSRPHEMGGGDVHRSSMMPPPVQRRTQGSQSHAFLTQPEPFGTPSHRTRLGQPSHLVSHHDQRGLPRVAAPPMQGIRTSTPLRHPLGHISPNRGNRTPMSGYGLSAGLKTGRQQGKSYFDPAQDAPNT